MPEALDKPEDHLMLRTPSKNEARLSTSAVQQFDEGRFVFVPALDEDATFDEIWERDENPSKPYQVRVGNLGAGDMTQHVANIDTTWVELDESPVEFLTDFQPCARRLHSRYICSPLRRACGVPSKQNVLGDLELAISKIWTREDQ